MKRRFKAIDLFSGCGGLTLGLRRAGFKIVAAIDNDSLAASTYKLNHKRIKLIEDSISDVNPCALMDELELKPGDLDLLAGCPPCQGFSTLRTLNGGRVVEDSQKDLVFQFLRFVMEFRPKTIMMENVPGLAQDNRIDLFRRGVKALGYKFQDGVLDAYDYGVPQRRRRFVFLASKFGVPEFPPKALRRRSVRGAIGRLPRPGRSGDVLHDYEVNRSKSVLDLVSRIPKDGGGRTDLSDNDQLECHRKCDGFRDIYGRMSWNAPAPTITSGCINPSKGRFLHPEEDRAITLREAAILQGFPRNYRFSFERGRYPAARLIGNAFPPGFARRHAEMMHGLLASRLAPCR